MGLLHLKRRRSPTKMEHSEVIKMEIQKRLMKEENEAVIEDDESEPFDMADRPYKEWVENHYLKEWENGRQK